MLLVFKSFSDVDDGTAYIYCFDFNRPKFDETNDNFHLGLGESRWLKSIADIAIGDQQLTCPYFTKIFPEIHIMNAK